MNDGNLGLVAGLLMLAAGTAIMLDFPVAGGILWLIGIGFAVVLGLSKRARRNAEPRNLENKEAGMGAVDLESRIRAALAESALNSWALLQGATADGRLVFVHSRQEGDQSSDVSILYRQGPGMPLRVELVVTEGMIDDANKGIDDFFFALASLLSWLGNLVPETTWAKAFPTDDAFVVREPSGSTWEIQGAWKYCR